MKYENPKLRQMLAAEYVLGTLRGRARRRFDKLAQKDAGLREEVSYWETRLADLQADLQPVSPPAAVWLGVQHRIQVAAPKVAPMPSPMRKPVVAAPPKPASLWRIGAGLASAAAVVAAVIIGQRIPLPTAPQVTASDGTKVTAPPVSPPTTVAQVALPAAPVAPAASEPTPPKPEAAIYVALLKLPNASLRWTMSLAPDRGRMNVAASGDFAKLGKHSLELWAITPSGPVALGVLPITGTGTLTLPADIGAGETVTLAISLEPVGGSPTGKPTGPVLTSGAAVKAA